MNRIISNINWIQIPAGTANVGSTLKEIDQAYQFWSGRLLDEDYKRKFKEWLMKEFPKHKVELNKFHISDILVTNEMYRIFCEENNKLLPESLTNRKLGGEGSHPVWGVSIEDTIEFTEWLSKELGLSISIPTEAQWEYAARGETRNEYPWGNEFNSDKCNSYESNIHKTTHVKCYPEGRSYFGLYDMGGNVEEWVLTRYEPYPNGSMIIDDLIETLGKNYYILKGGSFARGGDLCRVARRHGRHPDDFFRFTGFRLVINP